MGKDSLQPTWVKKLSSIIMSMDTDSKGNVWVGSTTGTLTKFNGNGVASSPIKLDNPVYSVTVDKSTDDVYVGDSANNVYKYSSSGTLKWGKNLGVGNQAKVPLVSTINGTDPDERGNFDLTSIYYSQKQIEEMLAPLGKTKSVNGVKPDDAGNVVLDFSNYFTFKGTIDDKANLDKTTDTGWYIKHNANGQNSTFLVFSDTGSTMQIECGYDNSIKERSSNGNKFTNWNILTNNVKTINGIKPDSDGNIKLDLTGNIKSVNNVKPDKDGNIQLGIGSKNTIKSINTVNKPDEFGNVQVPTFAPNLLKGTTNKKQEIAVNKDATSPNLISDSYIATDYGNSYGGFATDNNGATIQGEQILSDVSVTGGESYTYRVKASTTNDTLQLPGWSGYSLWRRVDASMYLTFKDKDGNVLSVDNHILKHSYPAQDKVDTYDFTDTFTAPADAVSVSLWYNGLEQTSDNLISDAYWAGSNDQHQTIDDHTFDVGGQVSSNDRVVVKIQCEVENYKSGSFLTVKTKNVANHDFTLDNSSLDSKKTLIAPIDAIDESNLVENDGFYTWEYTLDAEDLVGFTENNQLTVTTNIVGNYKYTIKVATWSESQPKPDMSFVTTTINETTTDVCQINYNWLNFWNGTLYPLKALNRVDLGSYNLMNDYIALDDTVGKYSASAHVDMGNSQGYAKLVLLELNDDTIIDKAESQAIPVLEQSAGGNVIKDVSSVLKTNSINNTDPKDNYVIKLCLDIYGQTDTINVSQQKLAQWKDNDQTPPDLTWFPSVQDIGGSVQRVNNNLPDKNGNVDITQSVIDLMANLSAMSEGNVKNDFIGTSVNPDTVIDTGTYRISNCSIVGKCGNDGSSSFKGNQWGWLINLNYGNDPKSNAIYQLMILNEIVYYRVMSVNTNNFPAFRTFVYDTDLKSLKDDIYNNIHKEVIGLDAFNASYGNNIYDSTINLDTFATTGLTKLLNCSITTSGKMAGHTLATKGLYGWIANVPVWNGAEEVQQFVYIKNYGSGSLLYVRDRVHVGDKTDFEKFTTSQDLANINTLANPIMVNYDTYRNLNDIHTPGIYAYIPTNEVGSDAILEGTPADDAIQDADSKFVHTSSWVLYVNYKVKGNDAGTTGFIQTLYQDGYFWFRFLNDNGDVYTAWQRLYKEDIDDLNNKIADLNDKFPISILEKKGNAAVIESSINNWGKIVYYQ